MGLAAVKSPQDSVFSGLAVWDGEPAGEHPGGAGSLLPPGGGGNKPKPPVVFGFGRDDTSEPSFFYNTIILIQKKTDVIFLNITFFITYIYKMFPKNLP